MFKTTGKYEKVLLLISIKTHPRCVIFSTHNRYANFVLYQMIRENSFIYNVNYLIGYFIEKVKWQFKEQLTF